MRRPGDRWEEGDSRFSRSSIFTSNKVTICLCGWEGCNQFEISNSTKQPIPDPTPTAEPTTKPAPKPSPLNCYSCDSSACDANHPGSIVVSFNLSVSIHNQTSSQDCSNQTPPPVGPTYCTYVQSWIDPEAPVVQRGCADLHETPELPEPPLGGVVCVDQDWKKVVSCLYNKEILHSNVLRKRFLRFVDIIF